MSDDCPNCGSALRAESAFRSANQSHTEERVRFVNFIADANYAALCTKCGEQPLREAYEAINIEIVEKSSYCRSNIADFPMFTLSCLPAGAKVRIKNMVTANVTVGTGIFSEFSQGFSDMFGLTNENSGMSLKVNQGETAARSILVMKAASMHANCILGVDIDYGVTNNNAATVNMQGTAALISNLADVLGEVEFNRANAFHDAQLRIAQLRRWKSGDITT